MEAGGQTHPQPAPCREAALQLNCSPTPSGRSLVAPFKGRDSSTGQGPAAKKTPDKDTGDRRSVSVSRDRGPQPGQ